ncbi:C11orf16 [Branchiostoma lanceolatum]|uniref:C11orf16 protein n=1 Tax=Branchiostoma lanceolatum TaxID=7740 RepID=A0A8K0EII7_BRALA|nr:C11orf16 [Branchiostoma lanceolatum]
MTAAPVLAGRGFPTMFGEIRDQNVTFCVDTSGSMYNNLSVVKDHLTEALLKVAYTAPDKMFNIIEFSTEVDQWADRMVKCTPHTVTRAAGWIRALTPKTGTNTLDALLTALGDPECTAVYLVTDGLPDQAPHDILQHVAYSSRGRPIHCIFLTHTFADAAAHDFLQDVAVQTRGSFHIITLTVEGNVHRVTPVYRADHSGKRPLGGPLYPPLKSSSVMTRLDHNPFLEGTDPTPIVTYTPWEPVVSYAPLETVVTVPSVATGTYTRPLKLRNTITGKIVDMTSLEFSPSASLIMRGTRVLARRDEDGYYYMGTVANQLPDAKGRFMIEFDKVPTLKSRMQETGIYDMIAHLDAFRHKIVPGDKVLAPWEVTGQRFGPGSVLEGVERRFEDNIDDDEDLVVTFWNGKTESVPRHKAIWIPLMLYERVIFELQMPVAAREKFLEANPGWPYESPPGYPSTYIVGDPVEFTPPKPARIKSPHLVSSTRQSYMPTHYPTYPYPWYWYPVVPSALETKDDGKIPGANVTKDQLNRKVLQQLRENKLLLDDTREEMKDLRRSIKKSKSIDSGLSSLSDYEDWYEYEDFTPRDKSTNTDWSLYKETQGTQKDERPPWRYWSRTPRSPVSKAPHPPTSKPTKRYPAFRDTTVDTPMELLRGPNDEQVVEPPVVPRGSYGQTNSCRLTPARPYTAPGGGNERRVTVVTGPNDYDYSVFNTVNHSQPPAQPPQGPPNKSSAFQNVDHTFRRSINMREAMMHPQPPPASPYLAQRQDESSALSSKSVVEPGSEDMQLVPIENFKDSESEQNNMQIMSFTDGSENKTVRFTTIKGSPDHERRLMLQTKSEQSVQCRKGSKSKARHVLESFENSNGTNIRSLKERENFSVKSIELLHVYGNSLENEVKSILSGKKVSKSKDVRMSDVLETAHGRVACDVDLKEKSTSKDTEFCWESKNLENHSMQGLRVASDSNRKSATAHVVSEDEFGRTTRNYKTSEKYDKERINPVYHVSECPQMVKAKEVQQTRMSKAKTANLSETTETEFGTCLQELHMSEKSSKLQSTQSTLARDVSQLQVKSSSGPSHNTPPSSWDKEEMSLTQSWLLAGWKPNYNSYGVVTHKCTKLTPSRVGTTDLTMVPAQTAVQDSVPSSEVVPEHIPKPPPPKQRAGLPNNSKGYPLHETMGRNQNILGQEEAENTLSEFRRRREMLRRQSEHRQKSEAEEKAAAIQAAKRQQALQFIKQDIDRHESNEKKVHNAIEAKRCVTNSIQQYEKNREDVHFQRDQERVAALQQRQVRHEVLQQQRMQEKDDTVRRRREGHEARIAMHNLESEIKYDIEQGKLQTRDVRRKIAESQRREFFHKKEMAAQEKKNLKATLDEQKLQMYRSHVLP